MGLTKDQIMGALPKLSQRDLLAIKTLASALLQQGAPDTQNSPENAQGWLFVALAGVLNMGYRLPASTKSFNTNAAPFLVFVGTHFNDALNRKVQALSLMNALLKLLVDDLKARQIPVTWNTMVQQLPRIAPVFEMSFPGYLDAGLAQLFTKGKQSGGSGHGQQQR